MTALETAITNVYEPEVWSEAFIELTTSKSLLIQSGIATADPAVVAAANTGGRIVYMPFWDDLPHDTGAADRSKVATDDDTAITPAGMTADQDVAYKHFRTQAFRVASVVKYVTGQDPARIIPERLATWWQKEEQRLLLKTLTGVFLDATVYGNLQNDISGEVATTDPAYLISSQAIEDTRFKLGDHFGDLSAIIMHSTPFKRLRNLNLIDVEPASDQNASPITMYQGMRVLVDDGMTTAAGSTSGTKYYTYLFGPGAIARVDIPLTGEDSNVELYRNPTLGTGAGSLEVITRRYFLLHPRGIKYTDVDMAGVSPSDAELAADNWTQAYLTKNIRIARLVTNG